MIEDIFYIVPRQEDFTQLARNFRATIIISMLHVVFNGCEEVPSKLREVFLLGPYTAWGGAYQKQQQKKKHSTI